MPLTEAQREARDTKILDAPDPERIWLQPKCCGLEIEGRGWCEDHPGDCDDEACGMKAVEYIRADLVADRLYQAGTEVANAKIEAQRLRTEIEQLKANG